jgi:hypothetical protein
MEELYENRKHPEKDDPKQYPRKCFGIPSTKRDLILKENGIPLKERQKFSKEALISKRLRIKTANSSQADMEHEERMQEFWDKLRCRKEETIEIPGAKNDPKPILTEIVCRDCRDVCNICSVRAAKNNEKGSMKMYTCDHVNHPIPEKSRVQYVE